MFYEVWSHLKVIYEEKCLFRILIIDKETTNFCAVRVNIDNLSIGADFSISIVAAFSAHRLSLHLYLLLYVVTTSVVLSQQILKY